MKWICNYFSGIDLIRLVLQKDQWRRGPADRFDRRSGSSGEKEKRQVELSLFSLSMTSLNRRRRQKSVKITIYVVDTDKWIRILVYFVWVRASVHSWHTITYSHPNYTGRQFSAVHGRTMGLMSIDRVCIPAGWLDPISDNSNLVGKCNVCTFGQWDDGSSWYFIPRVLWVYFVQSR